MTGSFLESRGGSLFLSAEVLAADGPGGNRVFAAVEQVNPDVAHVAQQVSDRGDTSPGAGRSNVLLCGRLRNADPSLVCKTPKPQK